MNNEKLNVLELFARVDGFLYQQDYSIAINLANCIENTLVTDTRLSRHRNQRLIMSIRILEKLEFENFFIDWFRKIMLNLSILE